jgi:hypothetical protein
MAVRLGEVLYWAGLGLGGFWLAVGSYVYFTGMDWLTVTIIFTTPGILLVLLGRACLYVLANR